MANLHAPDDKVISLLAALRSIDAADRSTHLMKMAELDPSFHEQELVQDLRRRVEAAVDDKELHGGSLVFSEISEDPSFDKLRDDWLREIQASLEKGGRDGEPLHIENLPVMSPSQEAPGSHNSGGEADRMTSAGEWEDLLTSGRMTSASIGGDSEFGAFGGFGLGDLPPYELLQTAGDDLLDGSLEVRLNALQNVNKFTASDLVACEFWPELMRGMGGALADEDERVVNGVMELLPSIYKASRKILTLTHHLILALCKAAIEMPPQTGDMYNILARHLTTQCNTMPRTSESKLHQVRLLHLISLQIHLDWVAFHEDALDEVVNSCLDLLTSVPRATGSENTNDMNWVGSQLFILIDPLAKFFAQWALSLSFRRRLCLSHSSSSFKAYMLQVLESLSDEAFNLCESDLGVPRDSLLDLPVKVSRKELFFLTTLNQGALLCQMVSYVDTCMHWFKDVEGENSGTIDKIIEVSTQYLLEYLKMDDEADKRSGALLKQVLSILRHLAGHVDALDFISASKLIDLSGILNKEMKRRPSEDLKVYHLEILRGVGEMSASLVKTERGYRAYEQCIKQYNMTFMRSLEDVIARMMQSPLIFETCLVYMEVYSSLLYHMRYRFVRFMENLSMICDHLRRNAAKIDVFSNCLLQFLIQISKSHAGTRALIRIGLSKLSAHELCSRGVDSVIAATDETLLRSLLSHASSSRSSISLYKETDLTEFKKDEFWCALEDGRVASYAAGLDTSTSTKILFSTLPALWGTVISGGWLKKVMTQLVCLESEEDRRGLVFYEDAHELGLEMSHGVCGDLDLRVHLDLVHGLCELLLEQQRSDMVGGGEEETSMIDGITLTRHKLLLRLYSIGGPLERPRIDGLEPENTALFCSFPPPESCVPHPTNTCKLIGMQAASVLAGLDLPVQREEGSPQEMTRLLFDRLLPELMESPASAWASQLIEYAASFSSIKVTEKGTEDQVQDQDQDRDEDLVKAEVRAASLVSRYYLQVSSDGESSSASSLEEKTAALAALEEKLVKNLKLLGQTSIVMNGATKVVTIDWFVLVASCILETSDAPGILSSLAHLPSASSFWPMRGLRREEDEASLGRFTDLVDLLVAMELPGVHVAFEMAGLSLSAVVSRWVKQCFLDVLDWPEIQVYMALSISGGSSTQALFIICLLNHLEPHIRHLVIEDNLHDLLTNGVTGFSPSHHLDFIRRIEEKHHTLLCDELPA